MTNYTVIEHGEVQLVVDLGMTIGECPRWSSMEECLYFVDIAQKKIYRFDPANKELQNWGAPEEPGCIAQIDANNLIVALRSEFAQLNLHNNRWTTIARVDHDTTSFRFNDGRCDHNGRFWASTMFEPRTSNEAALYCLEKGQAKKMLGPENNQGVKVGNGLAFDSQNNYMYRSDTPNHVIYRHSYDVQNGVPGQVEEFTHLPDNKNDSNYGGRPDGAALDVEGCYWSAQFDGSRILRFSPEGKICGEIRVPVKKPTMVAFGNKDYKTLYITSANENMTAKELNRYPQSGGVHSVELNIAGLPEPLYQP